MTTGTLRRTALYRWHAEHSARMTSFAGWEMPVQYADGPLAEHHITRRVAGLFDIDHMVQIEVRGPQAEEYLNHLLTYDITRLKPFRAHYTCLCYADGGVVDDPVVYQLAETAADPKTSYYLLVLNAINGAKGMAWLRAHSGPFDVTLRDVSEEMCMFALQGPYAVQLLDHLTDANLAAVPRFGVVAGTLWGEVPTLFSRTGYTGEDGFEIFLPSEHAWRVWEGILTAGSSMGVKPVGLAARDSLRFEACMPLYGNEIGPHRTPIEAGLKFALSLDKEFIGRDALLKQALEGPAEVLVGFEMCDRSVPRHGHTVQHHGRDVGTVTTGMYAPTIGRYLGMAYVPAELAQVGTEIEIIIHDRPRRARIVPRPFYTPAYRRSN
ncbi:MAG: glycine cleavage system aminomethyltransferase GcvT [Ardenticatenia bacterium]|nr:MAG: glycine cleavage system aminomethyltransferase GcvT [Ardenticatenia bacterium]